MRIVITGGAGVVGAQLADEFSESEELLLIDRRAKPGLRIRKADLSHRPLLPGFHLRGWPAWFEGADVVVHCSAVTSPEAGWSEVIRHNVTATKNVLDVASAWRISRVVFASSNWVVRATQEALGPRRFEPDGPKITSVDPLRPLRPYGFSKAAGELLGRMMVDEGRLQTFIAVRIGNCSSSGIPSTTDRAARNHWISDRDLRSLIRRCVEEPITGFHTVFGVSGQPESPFDLSSTRQLLSWSPEDNANDFSRDGDD